MAPKVHLMPNVERKLDVELHEQVRRELGAIFGDRQDVTAWDLIKGFTLDQTRKVVLAVATRGAPTVTGPAQPPQFQTHIVKLGCREAVACDVEGWQRCTQNRTVPRRMFAAVHLREISGSPNRAAAVYEDASQWYGLLTPQGPAATGQEVATLGWAADQAVLKDTIRPPEVQRAIRQVCRELARWFYSGAKEKPESASAFYRNKLKLSGQPATAAHRWKEDPELWELRRDTVWLLCGYHPPAALDIPDYVDPYDYVLWALDDTNVQKARVPKTLVGAAHGDLHGQNILVGVSAADSTRDLELEFPLVIDYGDMRDTNVIAWDFAKLETELKVRWLAELFKDDAACVELWDCVPEAHFQDLVNRWSKEGDDHPLTDRTALILFAFQFERHLADLTDRFFRTPSRSPRRRVSASRSPLLRAWTILQTIRREAAAELGERRGRLTEWRDEYYFALAVYGLNTAKFSDSYQIYHHLFALVSAGVALARMKAVRDQLKSLMSAESPPAPPHPCHVVPLYHAYTRWQKRTELDTAEALLEQASDSFDYAVPLRREYALLLAKQGQCEDAESELRTITTPRARRATLTSEQLMQFCRAFREIEVLSRIGRINKDKADAAWAKTNVPFDQLPAWLPAQFYRSAYRYYHEAFKLSGDYYPGGNAAVTALLAHEREEARKIAGEVSQACQRTDLFNLDPDGQYWVLATEGDMALISGDAVRAAEFYQSAFDVLPKGKNGVVEASYTQLCRLYMALGESRLQPVLQVFRDTDKFTIEPGPLGDCGGLFNDRNRSDLPGAGGGLSSASAGDDHTATT